MTLAAARNLALALPETIEKSHFGKADFRVRNRIFMTLPSGDHVVLKLTPEQQEVVTAAEPEIFLAVPGGWGRQGWTRLLLDRADQTTLKSAIVMAWRNVAPAPLRRKLSPSLPEPWSS